MTDGADSGSDEPVASTAPAELKARIDDDEEAFELGPNNCAASEEPLKGD